MPYPFVPIHNFFIYQIIILIHSDENYNASFRRDALSLRTSGSAKMLEEPTGLPTVEQWKATQVHSSFSNSSGMKNFGF